MSWQIQLRWVRISLRAALFISLFAISARGQGQNSASSAPPGASPDRTSAAGQNASPAQPSDDLRDQMRELQSVIVEMRTELSQSRADVQALRAELRETRAQIASVLPAAQQAAVQPQSSAYGTPQPSAEARAQSPDQKQRPATLEEDLDVLSGKVDEQYQTKVESASKYRVRLSGIMLTSVFSNRGSFDNLDFPSWAVPRTGFDAAGSFGATLRQSQLGLEVFGPEVAGAKTTADIQFDFAGGFPTTENGVTNGIVRLRTAAVHFDWQDTSVVAGQDGLFFSPLSPTSLASLAIPALGYSGNLWSWTPQVRIEHRLHLSPDSTLNLEAGILDPLTGEYPVAQFDRSPSAGERSSQPAIAARVSWSHHLLGRNLSFGGGGYYSRQNWGFNHNVDSWAATADWMIPLSARIELSGEFYRGRAVGGLGGGIGQSVLWNGQFTDPATVVRGLNSLGGWAQLKFRASERWEFNGAIGHDNPFAQDLRNFPAAVAFLGPVLARNQTAFVNFIYHPRSDLLFSTEYRYFDTAYVPGTTVNAGQLNMSVGVLF
ncbi:MAG TPA: hypothetical protein VG033_02465 [Candidatus Acidoferrales bacterium]|jgi:hypothetical protein|nr:hypothetical protein [Candidatus Acidoferrales bacterium]